MTRDDPARRNPATALRGTVRHANRRALALKDTVRALTAKGPLSYRLIAERLNAKNIPSPRGKRWSKTTVSRLVTRLKALEVHDLSPDWA